MKFEFGKYTEVTELAFKVNPDYEKESYVRFFICPDVYTFWFVRILKGYNKNYEREEGCFVLERNNIEKEHKVEMMSINKAIKLIENDSGDNYDIKESYDIDDLIDMLDDGFGILNLNKESI